MELQGKLLYLLPEVTGTSSKGDWKKQEVIVETAEAYPRKVCVSFWGEKVDDIKKVQPGETLKISINLESREYNNRWYTEVRAWKLEKEGAGQKSFDPGSQLVNSSNESTDLSPSSDGIDDLPF